jgi:hypothetical protein
MAGTEFIATGYRCESTGMVAAVWTSPDGANWSIASDNSETFAGAITTLEPAGSGLIAFGSDPLEPDGPDNPASTNTVLWTNVATDPTANQTTTTDSPEDGIQELGWSGDLPPLDAAQTYRTGSAGMSEPAFPVIAFTIPTDGWFGSYSSCYDRVEGVNLTSPHPGKLWIGTGLLLDHSEASLTAPQMRADLETSPEFRIDSAETVTVAGLPAQRLSITLLEDTTYFTQFDFGRQYTDNSWIPLPRAGQPATIWLIETGNADHADVIVLAESQPDVHQAFTDDAQRFVDSLRITSGPSEQCGA